jgi:hypothetical protein
MIGPRKKAMTQAGIGGAVVFAFVTVLLTNAEFWERVAAVAIVGFVLGAVCFIYGRSS